MKRINYQEAYSFDGACTNQAEENFLAACVVPGSASTSHCWRVLAPLCAGIVTA
jgi:hypothetical protein